MAAAGAGSLSRQRHYYIPGVSTGYLLRSSDRPGVRYVAFVALEHNLRDRAPSGKSKKSSSTDLRITPVRKTLHELVWEVRCLAQGAVPSSC